MKQILVLVLLVAVLSACAAAPTATSGSTTAPATSVATARPASLPTAAATTPAMPTPMAMPSPAPAVTAPAAAPASTRAASPTAGATVVIGMLNYAFVPDKGVVTVAPGTTVTWRNDEDVPHTVTADDKSYNSGDMLKGATFSHTFTTPGEYPYYCIWHGDAGGKGMSGKIIVSGQASGKSSSGAISPNLQGKSSNYDEETSIYGIDK